MFEWQLQVVPIDARLRAVAREHAVRGVAACARGGDDQSAFGEPLAVDALGIALDDLGLGSGVAQGGLLASAVALGTERGDVGRERR